MKIKASYSTVAPLLMAAVMVLGSAHWPTDHDRDDPTAREIPSHIIQERKLQSVSGTVRLTSGEISHELDVTDSVTAELTVDPFAALRADESIRKIYRDRSVEAARRTAAKDSTSDAPRVQRPGRYARLSPKAAALARAGGTDMVEVVVAYEATPDADEAERVSLLGADRQRGFANLRMKTLRVPASQLETLSLGPGVSF
ncbi:MAG: hypothetical protein PVG91_11605, partial [Gammaproteobacteria bacterium]